MAINQKLVLQKFGENVKLVRKRAGISQEKLGLEIGLDRTYISGIERGIRNPTLLIIAKIADGLKVSILDLFAAEPNSIGNEANNETRNNEERTTFTS